MSETEKTPEALDPEIKAETKASIEPLVNQFIDALMKQKQHFKQLQTSLEEEERVHHNEIKKLQAQIAQLREMVHNDSSRRSSALPRKLSAAKIAKLINNAKVRKLRRHVVGDGANLQLQISNNGAAVSWIFRYDGHRFGYPGDVPMGLGSYPDVDLETARAEALKYRQMLQAAKDPRAERDNAKLDDQIKQGKAKTVSQVADEYYEAKIARKSKSYKEAVQSWLKTYVHSRIGDWPIQKVDRNTILEVCGLRKIWTQKHSTARMVQLHILGIFNLAISRGYYRGENPAAWEGGLKHVLPASKDVHKVKHHASLPKERIGWFVQELRASKYKEGGGWSKLNKHGRPIPALVLEFIILTGVRAGEVLAAEWKEFNLKQMIWTVPPEHLKMGRSHGKSRAVPITKPMLAVLEEAQKQRVSQSDVAIVFPSLAGRRSRPDGKSLSHVSLWLFTKQLDIKITPHGFRSTFRDWCRAHRYPSEWWDIQVDHVLGNRTSQSYGHDDLLDERRGMMEAWGEYCSKPAPEPEAGEVVNLSDRKARIKHARD